MLKTYGNYVVVDGELGIVDEKIIEEAKELLLEHAEESMRETGVEIDKDRVEWVIRQAYKSSFGPVPEKLTDDSEPVITIGWKYIVNETE
ncbi:hypothetical protein [Paenibacillus polymyxa]|uniref:hypothetical protein n=1 Tax=Paenibacillus polymyxa TaxID=1406 RepID=UPI00298C79BE|nr:hypothetical protein [Paenibacillus polymyxa]